MNPPPYPACDCAKPNIVRPYRSSFFTDAELRLCSVCWGYGALGESNDADERVGVEIRAAEIAATLAATQVPVLNECERHGWECHANAGTAFPILCEARDFHAGWLARVIAENSGGGGGE